jgi:hypothetical protein
MMVMKYVVSFFLSFNVMAASVVKIPTTPVPAVVKAPAGSEADFLNLCKTTLKDQPQSLPLCETIHKKFFSENKTLDLVKVTPKEVGAPASPLDDKIQFFMFNDPNYLSGIAYCYFVYRNWISSSETGPDALAMTASGFSILNEDIPAYQKWIKSSSEGKKCKARVEKESEVSVADLEISLAGRVALIGLNPYASIQNPNSTAESVMDEMKLTVNHERIHAYQVACPEFEKWSIKEWEKLPFATKNEYIKKYPSYTWSLSKVAGREYIAFLYEKTPEKIGEHVKNCKIK